MIVFETESHPQMRRSTGAEVQFDIGFLTQIVASQAAMGAYRARRRASPEFATAVYDAVDQAFAQEWPKVTMMRSI
jgi:hypothetical protein